MDDGDEQGGKAMVGLALTKVQYWLRDGSWLKAAFTKHSALVNLGTYQSFSPLLPFFLQA